MSRSRSQLRGRMCAFLAALGRRPLPILFLPSHLPSASRDERLWRACSAPRSSSGTRRAGSARGAAAQWRSDPLIDLAARRRWHDFGAKSKGPRAGLALLTPRWQVRTSARLHTPSHAAGLFRHTQRQGVTHITSTALARGHRWVRAFAYQSVCRRVSPPAACGLAGRYYFTRTGIASLLLKNCSPAVLPLHHLRAFAPRVGGAAAMDKSLVRHCRAGSRR